MTISRVAYHHFSSSLIGDSFRGELCPGPAREHEPCRGLSVIGNTLRLRNAKLGAYNGGRVPLTSGARLGPYEVLSPLGAGGMGEVYLARDTRLGREVAIKVLPAAFASDGERLARFEREARAASALNHPNILTVFDVGEQDGLPYLVTELVEGESLRQRLCAGALPGAEALDFALQIARGLGAAHETGIVHRDLKPENLMIARDGRLRILDFGLAKLRAPLSPEGGPLEEATTVQATRDGAILGTVGYMAPEQVRGEPADPRSDLFALGCVFYEMLTGRRAFQGASAVETLNAILREAPPELAVSGAPPAAANILQRCLAKRPDERFQSAHDLAFSLREALGSAGGGLPRSRSAPWLSRRAALGAGLAAAAGLGLIVILTLRGGGARESGRAAPGAGGQSIAVLPLDNLSGQDELDYLRLALPDVIATSLSRTPQLLVRPFSRSRTLGERTGDPGDAGRELRASVVVTGHYLLDGANLRVSLEAFDVDGDRVLWRDALSVEREDLLGLDAEVARRLDGGLVPALRLEPAAARSVPRNREAYELFLRATAQAHGQPRAIELLEQSTALDGGFAPAWSELGWRQYQAAHWSAAGEADLRSSEESYKRALALDPSMIEAGAGLAFRWTEEGRLEVAYDAAAGLVERRPDSAVAHTALAYVLRYGGRYSESLRHCAIGHGLDPHETRLGLCAWVALDVRNTDLARRYARTREGTAWASYVEMFLLLHESRTEEVLRVAARLESEPDWRHEARLVDACLRNRPRLEIEPLLHEVAAQPRVSFDGDGSFKVGTLAALCGQPDRALRLLRQAVEQRFCSHPLVDTDSLLVKVRDRPEFPVLRAAARACHERFAAYVESWPGGPAERPSRGR